MNNFRAMSLSLLIVLSGLPLSARGNAPDIFTLPDGHLSESYSTAIETVLRDTYRLKIETGIKESILQWALLEGELPAGLTLRTDGTIFGTPQSLREGPYRFRVKVIDVAVKGAEPLEIPLSLSVLPARLRLTSINGPALVSVNENPGLAAIKSEETGAAAEKFAKTSGAESLRRPTSPSTVAVRPEFVSNDYATPASMQSIPQLPRKRSLIARAAGILGLGQDGGAGGGTRRSCASSGHKVGSDEAHTPLTKDTSTQNTCVEFINLNTLKYRYEFNEERTTSAGPDISSLPFLPKIPLTAATATTAPTNPAAPPVSPVLLASTMASEHLNKEDAEKSAADKLASEIRVLSGRFGQVRTDLAEIESDLRNNVEKKINDNASEVQGAHSSAKGLANGADLYLQSDDIAKLLGEVTSLKASLDAAILTQWPTDEISAVLKKLDDVTAELEDLRVNNDGTLISQDAWKEWLAANEGRYNRVRDRIPELKTKVNTINSGEAAFNESKTILAAWKLVIDNVNSRQADAFKQEAYVSCHNDEGENQSSKLTLTKTDRTATNQTAVSREVLTVNCYSRVAITAGFNFSTLDEKEFSVVQSAGATPGSVEKKFGFTSKSSFRPNPLGLLNVRFTNNPVYNWHASFGAVVDLKGETGTDVEPVAGVSLSIRRLIFITPLALHFGRVNKLAGGFNVGDIVPDAVATPPLEKAWKVGYTSGVTFRIAP